MDDMDVDTPLSEEEKYANFLKILETVRYLDDGGRITEDWVFDNMRLIRKYRAWISDYSQVNEEITDPTFRKSCLEAETLLRQLCHSIETTRGFDIRIYHIFMRKMKHIVETIVTDDEMANLLSMLSM